MEVAGSSPASPTMNHWKIQVPTPSAKRLGKDRTFIIEETGAFHSLKRRFPIPEGVSEFEFEFKFEENDPYLNREILDADISYRWYVEYKNSTGSRVEHHTVELEEIT